MLVWLYPLCPFFWNCLNQYLKGAMLLWFKESQLAPEPHRCPRNYSTVWIKHIALRMALVCGWYQPVSSSLHFGGNMLQTMVESTEQGTRKECELSISEGQLLGACIELSYPSFLHSVWVSGVRPLLSLVKEFCPPVALFSQMPWWGMRRLVSASKLWPKTC